MIADDIVLLSDNAPALQAMIDKCQKFLVNENSFQFSMDKSHVVVFGAHENDPFFNGGTKW